MGILIVVGIVLIFVIYFIIDTKIGNLEYRAEQHLLKNTGFSSSDIDSKIDNTFEKMHLKKLLAKYPNYTEQSIKELLRQYTINLFNRNNTRVFSEKVCEKMQKDSKLDKMLNMQYRRTNINFFGDDAIRAQVVYTDGRDEYEVYLCCTIIENGNVIRVDKYSISKGAVVGF